MSNYLFKLFIHSNRVLFVVTLVSIALVLFASSPVIGQESTLTKVPIGTRNNGQSNNPDGYVEYLPVNYDSREDWPVLIWHHGLGKDGNGSSNDLNKLLVNQIMNWLKINDVPFIILAPQDGNGYFGNGKLELFYNWAKRYYQNKSNSNAYHVSVLSASGAGLSNFLEDNNLAAREVSTLTINAALTGTGNSTIYNNVVNNGTKVWFHHGNSDGTVGYGATLNFYRGILNANGGPDHDKYRYTLYSGKGHDAWEEVYDNSGRNYSKVTGSISGGNYGDYYNWTNGSWYDWMLNNSKDGGQAPPTVNAGSDIVLNLPSNSTNLTGSATSSGGTIDSYLWTKINGPTSFTLTNETNPTASISDLVEGVYTFRLTATDDLGQSSSDDIRVTVNNTNQTPLVTVMADIAITLPTNSVTITSSSSDPDGTIASRAWTQRQGPSTASLSGTGTGTLNASNLVEGTYRFRLTVTDDDGATNFDQIDVTVNPEAVNNPPSANAGADRTINLPTNSLTITGSGSDSDGSIATYLWEKVSGPSSGSLSNTDQSSFSASGLVAGTYTFRLTVTDDDGDSDSDNMQVTVVAANQNPVANAGTDKNITLPTNSVVISGNGTDNDGTISSYLWTQSSGPNTATLTNDNTSSLTASNLVEGVYTFMLTVTDDDGATGTDNVKVTVTAAPVNNLPTANAGPDRSITLPTNSVSLNGSGNDTDGTIASYAWTKVNGPAGFTFSDASSAITMVSNLLAGTYTFRLTVTDNDGDSDSDNVTVNVAPATVNQSPTANAGPNKGITLPTNSTTLSGSATDPDGTISTISWSQSSGPSTATLSGQTTQTLTVSELQEGIYVFSMEVTDNEGAIDTDNASVTVTAANIPPNVSAGPDRTIMLPTNFIEITGSATDTDGTIASTEWTQTSGTSATISVTDNTLSASDLIEGTYEFQFSATDNDGETSSDVVSVVVGGSANSLPNVSAGNDQTISLPTNSVNITGNATDSDGTIASYLWEQVSGTSATLSNETTKTLTVNSLSVGVSVFRLTATDNDGGSASDEVAVTVLDETTNQDPVADAGETVIISLPINSTTLNGLGFDNDGVISSYQWAKLSGPAATLTNQNTATLTLSDLVQGTYEFELTVTDDDGASASDQVQVIVNPAQLNQNPIANAGQDKTIVLPVNSTTIFGSASDPDGTIITYSWAQESGPNTATMSGASTATLNVSDLIEGVYTFSLTVTDDQDAVDEDIITIRVLPENTNIPPTANAGEDLELYLPTNSENISGSGSDDDGNIASYSWTKVSGPSGVTLTNVTLPTLSLSNLLEGIYEFRLTVTDNEGATADDVMRLKVFPETANQSPQVNAGADKTIAVSTASLEFNATASDPDGNIASFLWTQTSGPALTLENADALKLTVSGFMEGIYNFRLNVTDDDGAVSFDEVKLTVVSDETNTPPTANAGPDRTIKLPTNTATIDGSGTDTEGAISAYLWEKGQGPAVTIVDETAEDLIVADLEEGVYTFILQVTDEEGETGTDQMKLTVLPESTNLNPEVDAGNDEYIDEDVEEVIFTATATDEDGTIAAYAWEKLSGGNATLSGEDTEALTVTNFETGDYQFKVEVTDDKGAVASDVVNLSVYPVFTSPPPTVYAGQDTVLTYPQSSIQLEGFAESENLIISYEWSQREGPLVNNIPADSNFVELVNLEKGEYLFELMAEDAEGQTSIDDIRITVRDDIESNDFPIIFTPNNDGSNDYWVVDDPGRIEGCSLKIYDTYGKEVFSTNQYENDWDGTFNGSPLPAGAYYYVFTCSDSENISGGVRIVR
jgi:gliding motility-associated-like protein